MSTPARPCLPLSDGRQIPLLGFGVRELGKRTGFAVAAALEQGYRHIDAATTFGNEAEVGAALRESRIPREELFITTKLPDADQGFEAALRACERSLAALDVNYLDLYVIESPLEALSVESWHALCSLQDSGRCRSIGVRNFTAQQVEELVAQADRPPVVNQLELSPFLVQAELVAFCRARSIQPVATSPLTGGQRLSDPVVNAIARKLGRTAAQVFLRWGVQHGLVVVPRSGKTAHILENAELFDFTLDTEDMTRLDSLDEKSPTRWSRVD
jgi:diketogulonate reductase-like aldo/keto reductase